MEGPDTTAWDHNLNQQSETTASQQTAFPVLSRPYGCGPCKSKKYGKGKKAQQNSKVTMSKALSDPYVDMAKDLAINRISNPVIHGIKLHKK